MIVSKYDMPSALQITTSINTSLFDLLNLPNVYCVTSEVGNARIELTVYTL